ncbi:hypothetical protein DN602_12870 [Raoultella ornithinolytica]|nr:hypothetical protein DN602_12870 [Raoultella ornithinolytica]
MGKLLYLLLMENVEGGIHLKKICSADISVCVLKQIGLNWILKNTLQQNLLRKLESEYALVKQYRK